MDATLEGRLQVAGRVVAMAGAAVTLAVVAWYAQYLIRYAISPGGWGGAGILPLVFLARLVVAGCVSWAIVGLDARTMLRVFLAAFGISFFLLFGWYFMILGYDSAIFYIAVSADLLYLVAGLAIGAALFPTGRNPGPRDGHLEA